jgi:hypothetical protein
MFFFNTHKIVILSEAPHRYRVTQRLGRGVRRACPERSRGNPNGADPTHADRTLSTTEACTWRTRHGFSHKSREQEIDDYSA